MANPNYRLLVLRALLIVAAGSWIYAPALQGGWIMDDSMYIVHNALAGDPARLWKTWFAPGSLIEYYPIEQTVRIAQGYLWGAGEAPATPSILGGMQDQPWMSPTFGYHLTNLILHLVGALLVWRLLSKLGLRWAWMGGLLFAVHPANVESVAWMAELKNVLSLPPFLLAMCCWIDYQERGRTLDYMWVLGLFVIAMFCKIMMAPFPVFILLYAWWKRDRIGWKDVSESAPFFVVSLTLGILTILAGQWHFALRQQPVVPIHVGGLLSHVALAGTTMTFYFFQFLAPVGLLPMYPKWSVNPPTWGEFMPWLALALVAAWCWKNRRGWGRHVLLGLGFFLLFLGPFLGLNPINYMTYSWVLDHFLYLPMIGLIGLAVAAGEIAHRHISPDLRRAGTLTVAAGFAALAWGSHAYAGLFASEEMLSTYTVQHNPTAFVARTNLGNIMLMKGEMAEAIQQYREALRFNPNMQEAANNLGVALNWSERPEEAIAAYNDALRINPNFALAHSNLGDVLQQKGRTDEAIQHYKEAIRIDAGMTDARDNLRKLQEAGH